MSKQNQETTTNQQDPWADTEVTETPTQGTENTPADDPWAATSSSETNTSADDPWGNASDTTTPADTS